MNNDLISREALKKALKSNCTPELCPDYKNGWCEACCPHNDFEDLIDNAPTVTPTFGLFRSLLCEDCQAYATNRAIAKLADEYTRPHKHFKNICPNCGADIREGANNETN